MAEVKFIGFVVFGGGDAWILNAIDDEYLMSTRLDRRETGSSLSTRRGLFIKSLKIKENIEPADPKRGHKIDSQPSEKKSDEAPHPHHAAPDVWFARDKDGTHSIYISPRLLPRKSSKLGRDSVSSHSTATPRGDRKSLGKRFELLRLQKDVRESPSTYQIVASNEP
jgi:hypothetical protein